MNRITVLLIATDRNINLRADRHRPDLTASIPAWQPKRRAWELAVHLRAVGQGVIPVVAIRGIWMRSLANDRTPVPAILYRQLPCLLRHKCMTRDLLGVRQLRCGLFSPKLYTNGLSWQTISWYYPFKVFVDPMSKIYSNCMFEYAIFHEVLFLKSTHQRWAPDNFFNIR
jgi:hypothetical protein